MAETRLITSFFDQLGDHIADYGEGIDEKGKRARGRRRKKDREHEIDLKPNEIAVPDGENRVSAIRIQKNLPLLKELVAFVLNNKPGGWITPQDGVQVFLPTEFKPVFKLVQGNWSLDLAGSPVELKVKKAVLGMTISYPTALLGLTIAAAGVAINLRKCPDLLLSHVD